MLGTIRRKTELEKLFNSVKEIKEVYSSSDFSFDHLKEDFYVLTNVDFDSPSLLKKLNELYPLSARLYIVSNTHALMLQGTKLIWRNGRWYV